jgi:hypothetical protein
MAVKPVARQSRGRAHLGELEGVLPNFEAAGSSVVD